MAFETFDLGRVLQTAEAIKGMRSQAETDKLRNAYLGTQIAGANQQQTLQADQAQQEKLVREARVHYLSAQVVESAADPLATAHQLAPEMVQAFEAQHGAGSFDQLPPDVIKQLAGMGRQKAAAAAGIMPKPKQIDAGGKLVTIDENTGQPMGSVAPIDKSASPDALLSSQTSRQNNEATITTTKRGQDITSETTKRGQDMTAATAAANNPNAPSQVDKTWNVYQQAKKGLMAGLNGTVTGPVMGRIPAVTDAQQTAEGGVAATAPVLKQLFRTAGEGTFTDKDQELLLNMVPTRKDNPTARKNKLENIDNIIRAKLGKPVPEARSQVGGTDYLKFGGQWYVDDGS